jgi:ankyrin repeat protein
MKTNLCLLILILAATLARAQTNDLTSLLQQGLMEEQANRNLDAAIADYQSLAAQFDRNRQVAATAIFRLGECYRMEGRTNEAAVQYQRILSNFTDQSALATMSRENLAGLGVATAEAAKPADNVSPPADEEDQEILRIQQMIQNSPDLINAVRGANTPLAEAASKGWLKVATYLLDHGADVNAGDGIALVNATSAGNRAMVELLLARGADVNAKKSGREGKGQSCLYIAIQNGFPSVLEVLLAAKADVEVQDIGGVTPLLLAAQKGDRQMVSLLLEHQARVNAKDQNDFTPLMGAIVNQHPEIVKMLLAAGADVNAVNQEGKSVLGFAARAHPPAMVKMLLDAKADPNGGTLDTPLLGAAYERDTNPATLLLQAGANPNVNGAVDWRDHSLGFHYDGSSGRGRATPLWLAIDLDQLPMVQLLLKFKADPNDLRADGQPLIFGALDDTNILETLLDAGAKANPPTPSDRDGWKTPLTKAIELKSVSAVEILLKHGANPNQPDAAACRPLDYAAYQMADEKIFNWLLQGGANPNVANPQGQTPLAVVQQWFHQTLAGRFTVPGWSSGIPPEQKAWVEKVAALLRRYGAREKLPDWNAITVARPASGFSKAVFQKQGTNDWNQFTLLQTLQTFYMPETYRSMGLASQIDPHDGHLNFIQIANYRGNIPFPDLAHVTVVRPSHDSTNETRIEVNLLNSTNGIDCGKDVGLQFGDVVEIPEYNHALADQPEGLTAKQADALDHFLTAKVELISQNQKTELSFLTYGGQAGIRAVLSQPEAQKILQSSSDLSRVKVTRHDPQTGKPREWILDCSPSGPGTDFRLRDGDIVEVPTQP